MRLGLRNGETFPEKQIVCGRVRIQIMRHCKEGTIRSYVEKRMDGLYKFSFSAKAEQLGERALIN